MSELNERWEKRKEVFSGKREEEREEGREEERGRFKQRGKEQIYT